MSHRLLLYLCLLQITNCFFPETVKPSCIHACMLQKAKSTSSISVCLSAQSQIAYVSYVLVQAQQTYKPEKKKKKETTTKCLNRFKNFSSNLLLVTYVVDEAQRQRTIFFFFAFCLMLFLFSEARSLFCPLLDLRLMYSRCYARTYLCE